MVAAVRQQIGEGSLSRFVREALANRLETLRRESLVREMEAGYAAEAESSSLDPEWIAIETEGVR